jgi:hypothetical protein
MDCRVKPGNDSWGCGAGAASCSPLWLRYFLVVTLGLDPRAHSSARTIRPVIEMDYRVKPGNDS